MPIFTTKSSVNATPSGGVNNAIKDPFQGYDANVWMLDASGQLVNKGFFTSVQFTFRNATEPYMEMGQRVPRYLDGDFQIGWVCQRGMLDLNTVEETMGFPAVTRSARVGRSPRFAMVLYINAQELQDAENRIEREQNSASIQNRLNNGYGNDLAGGKSRRTKGKIVLLNCKLDTYAMGAQSGQKVIANQWEGLAEGYEVIHAGTNKGIAGIFDNEEENFRRTLNPNASLRATDVVGANIGTSLESFYQQRN